MTKEDFANLTAKDPPFLIQYMLEIAQASRECPDDALIIPYISISRECPEDIYLRDFGHLFSCENKIIGCCRTEQLPLWEKILQRIYNWSPEMRYMSFEGYVCAGSFPALACSPSSNLLDAIPHDADFYPYYDSNNLIKNNVHDSIMPSYMKFLSDLESFMDKNEEKAMIRRNESCTTICKYWYGHVHELQMIHRMACKVFFDGEMIYFTIDAALCLYFGINPVDWRRESPTHLLRTAKYGKYNYAPIYPGLPFSLANELIDKHQKAKKIIHISSEKVYESDDDDDISGEIKDDTDDLEESIPYYDLPGNVSLVPSVSTLFKNNTEIPFDDRWFKLKLFWTEKSKKEQEKHISDYDGEGNITEMLTHWYYAVSMIVLKKPIIFSVFSARPTDIILKPILPDIRRIIEKVAGGPKDVFYFNNIQTSEISRQLKNLSVSYWSRNDEISCKIKCLSGEQLQKYLSLQQEYLKLIEDRITELEGTILPEQKKLLNTIDFKISNPGAQFTSSFRPVRREKPEDYWGPAYVPFDYTRFQRMKFTLLLIRRFGDHPIKRLDIFVIKLLFRHLYLAHFIDLASNDNNKNEGRIFNSKQLVSSTKDSLPWHDSANNE
jgi:hypothetical protein